MGAEGKAVDSFGICVKIEIYLTAEKAEGKMKIDKRFCEDGSIK